VACGCPRTGGFTDAVRRTPTEIGWVFREWAGWRLLADRHGLLAVEIMPNKTVDGSYGCIRQAALGICSIGVSAWVVRELR
jgi:hypothetical protein